MNQSTEPRNPTPEPLTPAELAAIAARAAAATPGPWGTQRDLNGQHTVQARPRITAHGTMTDGDIATLTGDEETAYHNGQFIAYATRDIPALLAEVHRLQAERREPLIVRWDRTVIHPESDSGDDTVVCCVADDGRPIALLLDDEYREALGGQLLEPEGDGEVPDPRVAGLEALAGLVSEYRVPGPDGTALLVRRRPGGATWSVGDGLLRALEPGGWGFALDLPDAELYCWPDAEAAVAAARQVLGGGEPR